MVVEEVANVSTEVVAELISKVGGIVLWLQAIGVIVLLWIIFQIINLIVNRKKRKAIYKIREDVLRIEKKIDRIEKKFKKGK